MALVQSTRRFLAIGMVLAAAVFVGAAGALLGSCGPFNDVAADSFCPFVVEVFTLGITTGTTATTYDPTTGVNRLQMATFLSRSVDGVLKRGSRRAAMNQFWTTKTAANLGLTAVGSSPRLVAADGLDLWTANEFGNNVTRVRASDGWALETWTGASFPSAVLSAMGRIWVTGQVNPALLYRIDGSQIAGAVTTVATIGLNPSDMAYDGEKIWTANTAPSVSIVTPGATTPFAVTNVSAGFTTPTGILYDGANIWVTDQVGPPGTLLKLNSSGGILQTVTVGANPFHPVFDGTNIWVPNSGSQSVSVVRASTGTVLQTLTGNGLDTPYAVAFDGQRILVTNSGNDSVSLFKAADLSAIGNFSTGAATIPHGVCSDGVNFWIALYGSSKLARF
jgi:hypothetical protein